MYYPCIYLEGLRETTKNNSHNSNHVGSEVLTVVVMGYNTVWSIESQQKFRITHCLHLQGQRMSWARNQRERRWTAEQHYIPGDIQCPSQDLNKTTFNTSQQWANLIHHHCGIHRNETDCIITEWAQFKQKFILFSYMNMANDQREYQNIQQEQDEWATEMQSMWYENGQGGSENM
jgi:hypothetical protein